MSNLNTNPVILIATASIEPQPTPQPEGVTPLLMYGGVAVAVIFAMAYFSQIQLNAIAQLMKIGKTNKR